MWSRAPQKNQTGEVQCDKTVCSDAKACTLSHFPSAMQNPEVTKEKMVFTQTSGAVCVQASPVYSPVKYFKAALKHKNMKTKLVFVFATRIGKLSRVVKN